MKKILLILTITLLTSCSLGEKKLLVNADNAKTITYEELQTAFKNGDNINEKASHYYQSFRMACSYNPDPRVIEFFIKHGADATDNEQEISLFNASAYNPNPKVIGVLLNHGANINHADYYGNTILSTAIKFNPNPQVVEFLLNSRAKTDIYKNGYTILMFAGQFAKDPKVIDILIKHGQKVNATVTDNDEDRGFTPLMYASKFNPNPQIVEALLKHGANVKAKHNHDLNVLMIASQYTSSVRVIELLLKYGAKINARSGGGVTALNSAYDHVQPDDSYKEDNTIKNKIVKFLIAHGGKE